MAITENKGLLVNNTSSQHVEFTDKLLHTASVKKEDRNSKMAHAYTRKELLGGLEESDLQPADFYQILSLARRRREGDITRTGSQRERPASKDLAEALLPDFESFRRLASSVCLPIALVELAIIDNESLERGKNERNRKSLEILGYSNGQDYIQPEFVSVIAAFDEFATDGHLMQAWDHATSRVVKEDKRSIVGTPGTYAYAYIWDKLSLDESVEEIDCNHRPTEQELITREVATIIDGTERIVQIGLPEFYPIGRQTATELEQEQSPDVPKLIAHRLLSYFHACAAQEIKDDRMCKLDNAILLIVPFTRPRLDQSQGLSGASNPLLPQKSFDQEGGGVFILCHDVFNTAVVDEETREGLRKQNLEELEDRLQRLAGVVMWLMHRSALLEAKLERSNTREEDLAQYFHLIAKTLRRVRTNVYDALGSAEGHDLPDGVRDSLNTTETVTKRFEDIGEIARRALLLRSGRYSPLPLDDSCKVDEFEQLIKDEIQKAIEFAKEYGMREETRKIEVENVGLDLEFDLHDLSVIRTSQPYLTLLFGEVFKNALEHGGFTTQFNKIKVRVFSRSSVDDTYIIMSVTNPIRDEQARCTLKELFAKRRFYLGISQIEMLAQVYNLNPPHFAVKEDNAEVSCFIGVAR